MSASSPDGAAAILRAMKAGTDLGHAGEELEGVLTNFITDHAEVVTSYKGLGSTASGSREAMAYFEAHHPEVPHLLHAQAKELAKLLGKNGAAAALGQSKEPFDITVSSYECMFVVAAEEFDYGYFNFQSEADGFAQENYAAFIHSASMNSPK